MLMLLERPPPGNCTNESPITCLDENWEGKCLVRTPRVVSEVTIDHTADGSKCLTATCQSAPVRTLLVPPDREQEVRPSGYFGYNLTCFVRNPAIEPGEESGDATVYQPSEYVIGYCDVPICADLPLCPGVLAKLNWNEPVMVDDKAMVTSAAELVDALRDPRVSKIECQRSFMLQPEDFHGIPLFLKRSVNVTMVDPSVYIYWNFELSDGTTSRLQTNPLVISENGHYITTNVCTSPKGTKITSLNFSELDLPGLTLEAAGLLTIKNSIYIMACKALDVIGEKNEQQILVSNSDGDFLVFEGTSLLEPGTAYITVEGFQGLVGVVDARWQRLSNSGFSKVLNGTFVCQNTMSAIPLPCVNYLLEEQGMGLGTNSSEQVSEPVPEGRGGGSGEDNRPPPMIFLVATVFVVLVLLLAVWWVINYTRHGGCKRSRSNEPNTETLSPNTRSTMDETVWTLLTTSKHDLLSQLHAAITAGEEGKSKMDEHRPFFKESMTAFATCYQSEFGALPAALQSALDAADAMETNSLFETAVAVKDDLDVTPTSIVEAIHDNQLLKKSWLGSEERPKVISDETGDSNREFPPAEGIHPPRVRRNVSLSEGTVLLGLKTKYAIIRWLGQGSHGLCYVVSDVDTGQEYAVKVFFEPMSSMHEREVEVMRELDHPNIVRFQDAVVYQGRLGIVMENCPLGDLTNLVNHLKQRSDMNHELVTGLPEDLLAQIFVQILLALKQMHDLGMAHRDLKLANVYLMGTGDVKVGDFGTCRKMENLFTTLVGTPVYMAPEVLRNEPYSLSSDVWSLGHLIYELCTLKSMYNPSTFQSLMEKHLNPYTPIDTTHYSLELADIIQNMLTSHPDSRPTVNEILKMEYIRNTLQKMIEVKAKLLGLVTKSQ